MVNRNAQLLSVLLPGLELAAAKDEQESTLVVDLRLALSEMQRRLGGLGTSYQDVLDDVRQRSARRLLANTDLKMGEIAFVLGFEEVNSFMRAFQAWARTTPAQWRASQAPRRIARQASQHEGPARSRKRTRNQYYLVSLLTRVS